MIYRIKWLVGLMLVGIMASTQANTIGFTQNDIVAMNGSSVTFELRGSDFASTGPDAGGFSLDWDPYVLEYVSTTVVNTTWDYASVDSINATVLGSLNPVFVFKTQGDAGSSFQIAFFTFNVVGTGGDKTSLRLLNASGGWSSYGDPLAVNYISAQVTVPTPPPAVLLALGLLMMSFLRQQRQKAVSSLEIRQSSKI